MPNVGESDELKSILELCRLQQSEDIADAFKLFRIFGEKSYSGIVVCCPYTKKYISANEVCKAPSRFKADVCVYFFYINEYRFVSIKSENGAMYSIVNHTPRHSNVFQSGYLSNHLDDLDFIVSRMNTQRKEKTSSQDIHIENLGVFTRRRHDTLIDLLMYFTFIGSGSGVSDQPADSVLVIQDNTMTFFDCVTPTQKKHYASLLYPRMTLSMRHKQMPSQPTRVTRKSKDMYDKKMELCKPWIFECIEKKVVRLKGSLDIRIRGSR
jgi:hypothetical protein